MLILRICVWIIDKVFVLDFVFVIFESVGSCGSRCNCKFVNVFVKD